MYFDLHADGDRAAKETERKSSSCVGIKVAPTVLEEVQRRRASSHSPVAELGWYAATGATASGIQLQQLLTENGCPLPLRVRSN